MLTDTRHEADEILRELLAGEAGERDPYPLYRRLRALGPVHRSDLDGVWYVSGYDTVREVLLDPRLGKNPGGAGDRFGTNPEQLRRFRERARPSMILSNPPDHTRMRAPSRGPFMPGRMARLAQWVEQVVDERFDFAAAAGEADVISDIAVKMPVTVIGEMVGVPPEDRDEFPPLVNDFFASIQAGASAEEMDRADRAVDRFEDYFGGLIEQRRQHPADDLISHLVAVDGEAALDDGELYGTITLVFVAGFITTANLIGNGLLALFRHPGEMARLWREPELVPNAVEEMLRYDPPVQLVDRTALVDCEVGGEKVPAGSTVISLLAAANHEVARFGDPERLDVARPDANLHVSFAWGIHHCLGAPLARLEGRIFFTRLIERFARLELLDPDPPRRPGRFIRSLESLPVRFTPA